MPRYYKNIQPEEFDYPAEWTMKAIDKDGYYKLNDLSKIYNDPHRSKIGRQPTDPPIYNKDGFIVSKDGASCFDKPYNQQINKTKFEVIREYPNVPHDAYMQTLITKLADLYITKYLENERNKKIGE